MSQAFGGNRGLQPIPPEKGVFPLDHLQECKQAMREYMQCLKESKYSSERCRILSKAYLECRMDRNLMVKQDLTELGFKDPSTDLTAGPRNGVKEKEKLGIREKIEIIEELGIGD